VCVCVCVLNSQGTILYCNADNNYDDAAATRCVQCQFFAVPASRQPLTAALFILCHKATSAWINLVYGIGLATNVMTSGNTACCLSLCTVDFVAAVCDNCVSLLFVIWGFSLC
jgi:hypothetical protein